MLTQTDSPRSAVVPTIIIAIIGVTGITVVGFALLVVYAIHSFFDGMWKDEGPIHGLAEYQDVLYYFAGSGLTDHFPDDAEACLSPQMYYYAGTLQGGTTMQLRIHLPPAEFEALHKSLEQRNLPSHIAGDPHLPAALPHRTYDQTTPGVTRDLPANATTYCLISSPRGTPGHE